MPLSLNGLRITKVCFDYAVTLHFGDGIEVRIETLLSISRPGGPIVLVTPDAPGADAQHVLALLQRDVVFSDIDASGTWRASFADATELSVDPHDEFEAWSIVGPLGERVVCMPGGGTSRWTAAQ